MDMKKILQAMDGASTKPVEGSSSMAKFLQVVKEAEAQVIDGPNGMKTTINPDGTKTVSDATGTKTYDAQGQLVTTATPNLAGVQKTTDVKSGDVTTGYNQGPMSVSQTQTPGGYTKQTDTQYDLGTATVGQQTAGPNIAAGQLAGTTTNTVTNKQTGQAMQQIQGVGFGGASGPNVGKNYVGASTDDLVQHAANSTAGINPDDAATPVQARVAPAVSPTAPKTEKDVVDLNAKYNSKKPQAPAEDINRLRHLSGITEKDIEEAPVVKVVQPVKETKKGSGLIKHYFESVQTEAEQAFDQRRAKIKEQARRVAQRMREDAKVSAVDPAKKTITYTDDKTGISTTIPQAMAKPGEGGQVTVDKSQVNQAASQDQQPQPVKVGDMIKMMDTESSSAGVRMHRALQREKEKREFSQRYAEKNFPIGKKPEPIKEPEKDQPAAEGSENNNTTAQKIFFARSNKTPKGWSYDHVGFITQDGKQIQMSGHKGNDVYVTNDVTDDPEFPKQNIKIVSLSKPVSVPTTNSVGAENCGTFVANVLQANGIKGIDTQKIYSVFKKPQEQGVAEDDTHQIKGNELIEYLMKRFDMTREQAIELLKKKGLAEGDSGAKYKVRSIGKDKKGEYYVSPSTGEKVYKKAKVGDHEVPGSKEIKPKVAEGNEDPSWMRNLRLRK